MKISVKVKPNSKNESVKEVSKNNYIISVNSPPEDGKANKAVVKILAKYLNIKQWQIEIISGHTSKQKLINITETREVDKKGN